MLKPSTFLSKVNHLDQISHLNYENKVTCLCPYTNSRSGYCLNPPNSTEHRELSPHLKKLLASINIILFTLSILTYFTMVILRLEYSAHYMQDKHFAATEFQTTYLFVASVDLSIKSTFHSVI